MNLAEILEQFVGAFSFSESEHLQIVNDLKRIIVAQFLINVLERHPNNEHVTLLRKAVDMDDPDKMERILSSLFRSGEFTSDIKEITHVVLHEWVDAMQSAFSEQQKAKIEPALSIIG